MKAILLESYGGTDRFSIGERPKPQPGPGEVLIRIAASAVNPFDLMVRQGYMTQYIPLDLPAVLGGDAAGVIEAVGEGVSGFRTGDRVVADFTPNGRGAHAEYGVVPATSIAGLPDALSFEQGAALPKAGLTGRQTVDALGVEPGDRVLVSGALGSVGRAAIQYLRELGARPVAGVRPERLEEGRQVAGDALDITVTPLEATFGFAISAAGPVAENLFSNVRDGGVAASVVPVPPGAGREGLITILELFHQTDAATLGKVVQSAASGALVIPVARVLPLAEIAAAHQAVATGASGKIILQH